MTDEQELIKKEEALAKAADKPVRVTPSELFEGFSGVGERMITAWRAHDLEEIREHNKHEFDLTKLMVKAGLTLGLFAAIIAGWLMFEKQFDKAMLIISHIGFAGLGYFAGIHKTNKKPSK